MQKTVAPTGLCFICFMWFYQYAAPTELIKISMLFYCLTGSVLFNHPLVLNLYSMLLLFSVTSFTSPGEPSASWRMTHPTLSPLSSSPCTSPRGRIGGALNTHPSHTFPLLPAAPNIFLLLQLFCCRAVQLFAARHFQHPYS
jgi:hypothetical protein